jgi:hypothetical protein
MAYGMFRVMRFAYRHRLSASRDRRERAFAFQLAPVEQLAGAYTVPAGDQRDGHARLVCLAHQCRLFIGSRAPTALLACRYNLDCLFVPGSYPQFYSYP